MNNLAKAQKLVDQVVAEKGPITGKLITATTFQLWFTALQQQWARLKGVDIQIDPVSNTVAGARLRRATMTSVRRRSMVRTRRGSTTSGTALRR